MSKLIRFVSLFIIVFLMAGVAGCSQGEPEPAFYEVYVTNEAGEPVEGVTVQFCSDEECLIGKTDKDGIAEFDKEAGTYTVHVQKVPEGYEKDKTEYEAPAKPGRVEITLK